MDERSPPLPAASAVTPALAWLRASDLARALGVLVALVVTMDDGALFVPGVLVWGALGLGALDSNRDRKRPLRMRAFLFWWIPVAITALWLSLDLEVGDHGVSGPEEKDSSVTDWSASFPVSAGVASALLTAFALARFEPRLAWKAAWGWRRLRVYCISLGSLNVGLMAGLTAAEELGRTLRGLWFQTPFESLVGGLQVLCAASVVAGVVWGTRRIVLWILQKQLAGVFSELAVGEALWFLGLMCTAYPCIATLMPWALGHAPYHFQVYQAACLAGLAGGLLFAAIFLSMDRAAERSSRPLVVFVPDAAAPGELESHAARIARRWRDGPVTVLAQASTVGAFAGVQLSLARFVGSFRWSFPRTAGELERYFSTLPPVSAWSALPRRECFPEPPLWDAALRTLVTKATSVVVIADHGFGPSAAFAIVEPLLRLEPGRVIVVAPPAIAEGYFPADVMAVHTGAGTKAGSGFGSGPRVAAAVQQLLEHGPAPQALRRITIAYEDDGQALAEALVAQLDGREDANGALVDARALRLPYNEVRFWFRPPSGELVLLEHAGPDPKGEASPGGSSGARNRKAGIGATLRRTSHPVVSVRIGQPFTPGEMSHYGAPAHAGWLGAAGNVASSARDVAERLLRGAKEPLPSGKPHSALLRGRSTAELLAGTVLALGFTFGGFVTFSEPPPVGVPANRSTKTTGQTPSTAPSAPPSAPSPASTPSVPPSAPTPKPSAGPEQLRILDTAGDEPVTDPTALATLTLTWGKEVVAPFDGFVAPDMLTVRASGVSRSVGRGASIRIPPGEFTIASPDLEMITVPARASLRPGESRRIMVGLYSRDGNIVVVTDALHRERPSLNSVRIDGKGDWSRTDLGFRVPPGRHTVTLADPAYANWSRSVTVKSGYTVEVVVAPPTPSTPPPDAVLTYCAPDSQKLVSTACRQSLDMVGYDENCKEVRGPSTGFEGGATAPRSVGGLLTWMTGGKTAETCRCVAVRGRSVCPAAAAD